MLTVANKRNLAGLDQSRLVYVGRPSVFGNPFVVGKHGARGECIKLFEDWFLGNTDEAAHVRAEALKLADDAILVCWCAPASCHADVIARYVNTARNL